MALAGVPSKKSVARNVVPWQSLLGEAKKALAVAVEVRLPHTVVQPMKGQPREYFNEDAIRRLADSIQSVGQVYPGIVRKVRDGYYELLDGERRWRAVKLINIDYRALLVEIDDSAAPFLIAAIANFNREGHTPLEVADAIEKMYDEIGIPIEEIARVLGITQHWAYQMLSLRFLHEDVREMLHPTAPKEMKLPLTAAIAISKMRAHLQLDLAKRVLSKEVSLTSLRAEVIRVSAQAKAPVVTRQLTPRRRWESFAKRSDQMRRISGDLCKLSSGIDGPAILQAGFEDQELKMVLESLRTARKSLEECERQIEAHFARVE